MEQWYSWGLAVIRWIQQIESPLLTGLMKGITFLGSEYAYLALIPFVYWCIDEQKGLRLGITFVLSAWLNGALKEWLHQPRPYELDPAVGLAREDSFGIPSGHAQLTLTFWGIAGPWIHRRWGVILAVGLSLLVGFTRLYLGVHFPTDVVAGWLVGLGVLAVYYLGYSTIESYLKNIPPRFLLLLAALLAFCMNALNPKDVSFGGVFFGMCLGVLLVSPSLGFRASEGPEGKPAIRTTRALRYGLGIVGVLLLYAGLKPLLPPEGAAWYQAGRFVRYGLIGLWVSGGAPWLFKRVKLA